MMIIIYSIFAIRKRFYSILCKCKNIRRLPEPCLQKIWVWSNIYLWIIMFKRGIIFWTDVLTFVGACFGIGSMTGTIWKEEVETDVSTFLHKVSILYQGNAKGEGMTRIISIDGAEIDIPISCLKVYILHSDSANWGRLEQSISMLFPLPTLFEDVSKTFSCLVSCGNKVVTTLLLWLSIVA